MADAEQSLNTSTTAHKTLTADDFRLLYSEDAKEASIKNFNQALEHLQNSAKGQALVAELAKDKTLKILVESGSDTKTQFHNGKEGRDGKNGPQNGYYQADENLIVWNPKLGIDVVDAHGAKIGERSPAVMLAQLGAQAIVLQPTTPGGKPNMSELMTDGEPASVKRTNAIALELRELPVTNHDSYVVAPQSSPSDHKEYSLLRQLASQAQAEIREQVVPAASNLAAAASYKVGEALNFTARHVPLTPDLDRLAASGLFKLGNTLSQPTPAHATPPAQAIPNPPRNPGPVTSKDFQMFEVPYEKFILPKESSGYDRLPKRAPTPADETNEYRISQEKIERLDAALAYLQASPTGRDVLQKWVKDRGQTSIGLDLKYEFIPINGETNAILHVNTGHGEPQTLSGFRPDLQWDAKFSRKLLQEANQHPLARPENTEHIALGNQSAALHLLGIIAYSGAPNKANNAQIRYGDLDGTDIRTETAMNQVAADLNEPVRDIFDPKVIPSLSEYGTSRPDPTVRASPNYGDTGLGGEGVHELLVQQGPPSGEYSVARVKYLDSNPWRSDVYLPYSDNKYFGDLGSQWVQPPNRIDGNFAGERGTPSNQGIVNLVLDQYDGKGGHRKTVSNLIDGAPAKMTYDMALAAKSNGTSPLTAVKMLYGKEPKDPAFALKAMQDLGMTPAKQLDTTSIRDLTSPGKAVAPNAQTAPTVEPHRQAVPSL